MSRSTSISYNRSLYSFRPFHVQRIVPVGSRATGHGGPQPRSGHRCVVDESDLYAFGGYNPHVAADDEEMAGDATWPDSCPLFRELWRFNLASRSWTKVKTGGHTPRELASHAALLCGRQLMVFGGTGVPFGFSSSNSVHLCDLSTHEWQEFQTVGEAPPKQYGQAMALVDGGLYVIGGTTGYEYSIDVHRLDLKTTQWQELPTSIKPRERYRHEVACDGAIIYILGGGTATESYEFSEIPGFNLKTQAWECFMTQADTSPQNVGCVGTKPPGFPKARRCHSLVQRGEDVYICGGYDGEEIFGDIWRLNLRTRVWCRLRTHLPQPVYFHSAAVTESGCMYVFGGVTCIHESTRTADVYSVWLGLPSLQEMCWQALLKYVPHLPALPKHTLLELGIPRLFVERIDYQALCG